MIGERKVERSGGSEGGVGGGRGGRRRKKKISMFETNIQSSEIRFQSIKS